MLNFSEITNTIKDIIDVRIKIVKEELKEEFKALALKIAILVVMGLVAYFVLWFLSFALAFWLGALTGSTALGFLLTAVFYMIICGILYAVKDSEKFQFSMKRVITKIGILFQTKETTPEYTNDQHKINKTEDSNGQHSDNDNIIRRSEHIYDTDITTKDQDKTTKKEKSDE